MTEKSPLRTCDDIDEVVLNYAEIKGLAMKNPFIKEKMQVETEINKLNLLKGNWLDAKERYKDKIENLPLRIEKLEKSINNINLDIETYKNNKSTDFEITLNNIKFNDRAKAGEYFMKLKSKLEKETNTANIQEIGSYAGLKVGFTTVMGVSKLYLIGNKTYEKELGVSSTGNITRLENLASDIESQLPIYEDRINEVKKDLENSKEQINKPFEYEERLSYLLKRKIEIDYNIENGITEETNQLNINDISSTSAESSVKVVEPIEVIEVEEDNNYIKANDLGRKLYNEIYDWGYNVFNNKTDYIRLEATGFDDIVLEQIGKDEYSLAHYSILNGDSMRSPEITFKVINKSIEPTSYLDDYLGDYQDYEELQEKPHLISDLKSFLKSWLTNIAIQFQGAIQKLKKQEEHIKEVSKIRELYPVGTMIMLESMANENLPKGIIGKVKKVDDIGQLQMVWQNGSSLALNIKTDKFKVLNRQINNSIENKEVEKVIDYEQDMEEI